MIKEYITKIKNLSIYAKIQLGCEVSTISMVILKLFKVITFSWWFVLSPILLFYICLAGTLVAVFIIAGAGLEKKQNKEHKKTKSKGQNAKLFQNSLSEETKEKTAKKMKDVSNKDKKEYECQTDSNHAANP